jgi:paraquat-inducible protein B
MSQRSNPTLIGAFVFGAMVLIVIGIILFTGSSLFTHKPRYVMYFEGSVYGLQIGAPVVFRGVQIGTVQQIDLRYDGGRHQLVIPVIVEGLPQRVLDVNGSVADNELPKVEELIERGLRARLATQSLLTGQLYVDLDLHPEKPLIYRAPSKRLQEIPTIPSPVQEIAQKLQQVDIESLLNDVAAIAESSRQFIRSPELAAALQKVDASLSALQSLSQKLDRHVDPLAFNMNRMGVASDELAAMSSKSSAPLASLKNAADELQRTIATLNELVGAGGPALYNAGQTLLELKEAARALQDLTDTLERQPDALLFGRKPAPRKEQK